MCNDATDCYDGNDCTTDTCNVTGVCEWTADTPCGPFIDHPLPGKKIKLQIPPGVPDTQGLRFLATKLYGLTYDLDEQVTVLPDLGSNPADVGGSLRLFSTAGPGGTFLFDETYPLPRQTNLGTPDAQVHWYARPSNAPDPNAGYIYRDAHNWASPISLVNIKGGKTIKMKGKSHQGGFVMHYSLDANPDPVQVVLTLGRHRYCWSMGENGGGPEANTLWNQGNLYLSKDSVEPASCP